MYPDINMAKNLVEEIYSFLENYKKEASLRSRIHYNNVSQCARKIALKTPLLNPKKAYVLGLLHDYGEYTEITVPKAFHGTAGYDSMVDMGYDEVAKICLTHSFFEGIIEPEYFTYNKDEIIRAKALISKLQIDDYDRLIQLSDLLCCKMKIVTIEERIDFIMTKYQLPENQYLFKIKKAKELKSYFDSLCNQNIYNLLGIK